MHMYETTELYVKIQILTEIFELRPSLIWRRVVYALNMKAGGSSET
jgi:hypothetical protein